MSTARRHAIPWAVTVLAIALFLAAFLAGPGSHAGPVTGAPGPHVLIPPAAGQQVTVTPDKAAMHRAHLAHLAHAEAEHVRHVRHLAHAAHEAGAG